MTIVSLSTVADNNQSIAPENTMVVNKLNDAIRDMGALVRGFGNELAWYRFGSGNGPLACERVSSTSFRVAADLRAVYVPGRRVRVTGNATGDIQGFVVSRSFQAPYTTVQVAWDSGALASETLTLYVSAVLPGHLPHYGGLPLILSENRNERMFAVNGHIDAYAGNKLVARFQEGLFHVYSDSDSTGIGPNLHLTRRSPNPANGDGLGVVNFYGRDSSVGNDTLYARVGSRIINATAGSISAALEFLVANGGSFIQIMRLRPGSALVGKSAADNGATAGIELHTSGDVYARDAGLRDVTARDVTSRHAAAESLVVTRDAATPAVANRTGYSSGTVDVVEVQVNGTRRGAITWDGDFLSLAGARGRMTSTQSLSALTGSAQANHNLGGVPFTIDAYMICTVSSDGYTAGDIVRPSWQTQQDADAGWCVWANATQVGVTWQTLRVVNRTTNAVVTPNVANWSVVLRAQL